MPSDLTLPPPASAKLLLRHQPFICFSLGRVFSTLAYQMGAVAVGWQVYALTHSAFDLGLIGLWQFLPMALLTFAAGHAADRYERKQVLQWCQIAEALTAAVLAWGTFARWLTVDEIFAAGAVLGAARAFGSPASSAMLPGVVPEKFEFTVRNEAVAQQISANMGKRLVLTYDQHKGVPGSCFGDTEYFIEKMIVSE